MMKNHGGFESFEKKKCKERYLQQNLLTRVGIHYVPFELCVKRANLVLFWVLY